MNWRLLVHSIVLFQNCIAVLEGTKYLVLYFIAKHMYYISLILTTIFYKTIWLQIIIILPHNLTSRHVYIVGNTICVQNTKLIKYDLFFRIRYLKYTTLSVGVPILTYELTPYQRVDNNF